MKIQFSFVAEENLKPPVVPRREKNISRPAKEHLLLIRKAGLSGGIVLNSKEEYSRCYIPMLTVEGPPNSKTSKLPKHALPQVTSPIKILHDVHKPTERLPKRKAYDPAQVPNKKIRVEPEIKLAAAPLPLLLHHQRLLSSLAAEAPPLHHAHPQPNAHLSQSKLLQWILSSLAAAAPLLHHAHPQPNAHLSKSLALHLQGLLGSLLQAPQPTAPLLQHAQLQPYALPSQPPLPLHLLHPLQ